MLRHTCSRLRHTHSRLRACVARLRTSRRVVETVTCRCRAITLLLARGEMVGGSMAEPCFYSRRFCVPTPCRMASSSIYGLVIHLWPRHPSMALSSILWPLLSGLLPRPDPPARAEQGSHPPPLRAPCSSARQDGAENHKVWVGVGLFLWGTGCIACVIS